MFLTVLGQLELATAPLNVSVPGLHFKSDIEVFIVRQATVATGERGAPLAATDLVAPIVAFCWQQSPLDDFFLSVSTSSHPS